jgi:polyisoprenoid-binding protein YceI
MRWILVAVTVAAAGGLARAQAPAELTVDAGKSSITYHLVHKLHRFDGVSHKVEGRARLGGDGKAQVMVRVPVESFDSGNSNRDEHMKETVEAARFPSVELKALADGAAQPASFPSKQKKTFKAQLNFHGAQNVFELPVEVEWLSANEVRATATFTVGLESYKIERPSLMFVKVDNEMQVDVNLVFKR